MKNSNSNENRYCHIRVNKLQRWSKCLDKKQRWFCMHCNKMFQLGIKIKKSNKVLKDWKLYFDYSTNKLSMSQYGMHRSTMFRHVIDSRNKSMTLPNNKDYHKFIFLDGKWTDNICALIAHDKFFVFKWQHVAKENKGAWQNFIKDMQEPEVVICDRQKDLLNAIKQVWSRAKIQYCIFRKLQSIHRKLTLNPVLIQDIELRQIKNQLANVWSFKDKYKFIETIEQWTINNVDFLKKRTICLNGKRKWFYTHKNIRSAWMILLNLAN